MSTYRTADKDAFAIIKDLINDHYPELKEAGVRVGCLLAFPPVNEHSGEPTVPALKRYGLPASATVRVVSHRDRVAGLPDAQILLDGDTWEKEWEEAKQRAAVDRMLAHLEIVRDEEGNIKTDDSSRPRLKIKPPDWLISGFDVIAKRHGKASLEVQEAQKFADEYGELLFGVASA